MNKKVYALKFNKKNHILEIGPWKYPCDCTDEVKQFNDSYFLCTDRKKLREKANELRAEWIKEAKENLEKFEALKVTNKY